jgi:hypothetical protein
MYPVSISLSGTTPAGTTFTTITKYGVFWNKSATKTKATTIKAYGAVTWGQFFIYQGFNDKNGWMHTTGGGDVADEYQLTVTERDGKVFYQYAGGEREMTAFRQGTGALIARLEQLRETRIALLE